MYRYISPSLTPCLPIWHLFLSARQVASGLRLSGATPCDTWIGRQVVLHGAPFGARVDGPGGALWSRFSQVLMRGIGGG